jgi:hypothetical protein
MKKVILALFALATALAISPVASAQGSYNFTFTSGVNTDVFSGTLVTGAAGGGGFNVTGGLSIGSDSFTIVDNASFPAPSTYLCINGCGYYDNLFSPNGGAANLLTSTGGLLFEDASGMYINIWQNGSGADTYGFWEGSASRLAGIIGPQQGSSYWDTGTFGITQVPEYGALAMLILSALTLAGGFFFKARQSGLFLAA